MEASVLHQLTHWFRAYVDGFRDEDAALHPMMEFKLGHSARVAVFSRTIAEQSDWSVQQANLAEASGWLHDVGRFSQWADFATYRDRASVDHAARGHEVLSQHAPLHIVAEPERSHLLDSVAMHNRLALPETLDAAPRALCQLVRDADKLDIFDVVYGHLLDGSLAGVVPRLSPEPKANPDILDEIRTMHRASYSNVRTHADFVLVSVAWAYDLSFRATADLASQKDVLSRLASFLPDTPEVRAVVDDAVDHLRKVVEESDAGRS
jgi:HD domain